MTTHRLLFCLQKRQRIVYFFAYSSDNASFTFLRPEFYHKGLSPYELCRNGYAMLAVTDAI